MAKASKPDPTLADIYAKLGDLAGQMKAAWIVIGIGSTALLLMAKAEWDMSHSIGSLEATTASTAIENTKTIKDMLQQIIDLEKAKIQLDPKKTGAAGDIVPPNLWKGGEVSDPTALAVIMSADPQATKSKTMEVYTKDKALAQKWIDAGAITTLKAKE